MNAVWFIFVVAVLNTGLGFAIAVHLGRRYRAVAGADSGWDFDGSTWPKRPENAPSSEPANEPDESQAAAQPESGGEPEAVASERPPTAAVEEDESPALRSQPELDAELDAESDAGANERLPTATVEEDESPALRSQPESDAESEAAVTARLPTGTVEEGESPSQPESDAESEAAANARLPTAAVGEDESRSQHSQSESDVREERRTAQPATSSMADATEAFSESVRTEEDGKSGDDPKPAPLTARAETEDERPLESDFAPDTPAGQVGHSTAGEEVIEAFLAEVEQYQEQLGQADGRLRSQAENPDAGSIRACLQSLLEASREYAEQREHARAELDSARGERPDFGVACEKLDGAVVRQDEQIESTERAIAAFPYTDDLSRGCRVMIDETTKLMDVNVLVRDALHAAGVSLARGEKRLADLDPRKRSDALTGADSRAALESTLLTWMEEDAQRAEELSIAAIDVDEFSRVNRKFGHVVGDQLLHALGKLFTAENRDQARLARFSGERFVLLFPDTNLRNTTNAVERLRQIVEMACFEYKNEEIRITVSCGVAEAAGGDTPETILTRAESTLMEAKRYGRNRTFIHEGKFPTPVVPPTFSIEQRRMAL